MKFYDHKNYTWHDRIQLARLAAKLVSGIAWASISVSVAIWCIENL